ncbi:bifunctional 2',3'-cyclic-nucleotide 2'-phosphodiesterase/3'-nucleotidase [Nioella aestuarii]|uniref:bifunctional 2',3'-cyclic-nucleotide 2'-phosphodiesterase/3'-nucleotidase n=1 Tax=Nioella aestuarii TaxID=1662864 RepID=UPI003D7F2851
MGTQAQRVANSMTGRRLRLVLLATTDLHANLRPYNYYLDAEENDPGLARIATLVDRLREAHPNCLLFDNGDTLQGTPLGDVAHELGLTNPHPMIAAMNLMGYDAATVGNHDFNYGVTFLEQVTSGAAFPVVVANVDRMDGTPLLPRSVLLDRMFQDDHDDRQPMRIGVLGLTPPQITKWDSTLLTGQVTSGPIVETAKREAAALRASGADLVIALCHSGQGADQDTPDLENALVPLAASHAVDAIVAGHTHRVFPRDDADGLIHGIPVVQPGFFGSHLGQITLDLTYRDGWQIECSASRVHSVLPDGGPVPASPAILSLSARSHEKTLTHTRRPIGTTDTPLESYFALAGNSPTLAFMADAKLSFARLMLQDHSLAELPLLCAVAPFKGGGRAGPGYYTDVPAGPLTLRNAADLYAFPNTLQVLRSSGADLLDWLERAASAFQRVVAGGSGQMLLDPSFSSYNFDVIFGLTYCIDVSQPARYSADGEQIFPGPGRIRDLCYNGSAIDAADEFLVATNSYRASGGGHFPAPARCEPVLQCPTAVRKILADHIAKSSPIEPKVQDTWRFVPLGDTRVIFETGPGAAKHADRARSLGLRALSRAQNGFLQFEMTL